MKATGLAPPPAGRSRPFAYTPPRPGTPADAPSRTPQPHARNPCRVSHAHSLALVRVRSPLLTESLLFSLPAGTEMFHFPAFPPHRLCVQRRVAAHDMRRGFPIRTPWDHSPVIDSPRLIADSHVLHRLPMPRHPPYALENLAPTHGHDSNSTLKEHATNPSTHPENGGTGAGGQR